VQAASGPQLGVDLYWLPLGAGGHSVRLNGRIFEAVAAHLERRDRCDLYHSALEVRVPEGRFVIEQAPGGLGGSERGVVAQGAVGTRAAGRFRLFRYEVRCWRDGIIPDVSEAVESPQHLSDDAACARRLLDLVPHVPMPVWGRNELRAGGMWNSNSIISWLLAGSGLDVESIRLPRGGRAPGWRAGIIVARRQPVEAAPPPPSEATHPARIPREVAGSTRLAPDDPRKTSTEAPTFAGPVLSHRTPEPVREMAQAPRRQAASRSRSRPSRIRSSPTSNSSAKS
jgi:hypothetical protein